MNWPGQGTAQACTHIEKLMNSRRFAAIAVLIFAFSMVFEAGSSCLQASGLSQHQLL
jgi:hypothetical protein